MLIKHAACKLKFLYKCASVRAASLNFCTSMRAASLIFLHASAISAAILIQHYKLARSLWEACARFLQASHTLAFWFGKLFATLESDIGRWWGDVLKEEMVKAGLDEKRKAVERKDFHQGVPSITVVCDGGWSKRTHKHSYNALGGVGVIFGKETKKLLYIGVRNKQCVLCEKAERNNLTADSHDCFRNWYSSSQSMESDIILQGFLEAEATHGLRYMRVIADGDSSVYAKLVQSIPVWGPHIKKLECANHTCKCIRSNLERLVQEKSHYKGKGKLTGKNIVRITTAVRCAIRMRSSNMNVHLLKHDIRNSVFHVLGFHERCSDFCQQKTSVIDNDDDDDDSNYKLNDLTNDDNSMDEIFNSQCDFWSVASEKEMNNSRKAGKNKVPFKDIQDIIRDVSIILGRVADRAERLCGNFTTNLAESWMAIRAKFDGGKMVNRCSRGSWTTRCYGGALRKNIGPAWSPTVFQSVTGVQAGSFFFNSARCQVQFRKHSEKYSKTDQAKTVRRKRKLRCLQESNNKKARLDYGSPLDDTPDVSEEKLDNLCKKFYDDHVVKTGIEIEQIEKCTVAQSQCELWKKERKLRLTSSNFGKVICRKPTNVSPCLVKTLLYSSFQGNINTIRGLAQEENTVIEYKNMNQSIEYRKTGLVICEKYPFLAASTDGIVTDKNNNEGIIEIKNLLQNNKNMIKEAVKNVPNFCLKEVGKGLQLKRNHHIYYQIQGQLNIMNRTWCDFILRRSNPHDIYIERIFVDKALWSSMVMKLKAFYFKFLLPELASPRYATASGIRKPISPWFSPPSEKSRNGKGRHKPVKQQTVASTIQLSPSVNSLSQSASTVVSQSASTVVSQSASTVVSQSPSTVVSQSPSTVVSQSPSTVVSQSPSTVVSQSPSTVVSINQLSPSVNSLSQSASKVVSQSASTVVSQSASTVVSQSASTVLSQSASTVRSQSASTVVSQSASTVVSTNQLSPSVDILSQSASTVVSRSASTVGSQSASTVVSQSPSTVGSQSPSTVVSHSPSTVVSQSPSTVVSQSPSTVVSTNKHEQKCQQKQRQSKRSRKVPSRFITTFVGRKIQHLWVVNEMTNEKKWYLGTITRVITGNDGCQNAVYEVQYEGEATACEIDNLQQDLNEGSLKFLDK